MMKYFPLILLFLGLNAKAQTDFDCYPIGDSISETYRLDAVYNAMLHSGAGPSTWKDSLSIDPVLTNTYMQAIMATRSDTNYEHRYIVFDYDDGLHNDLSFALFRFSFRISGNEEYAQKIFADTNFSVNPTIDSLDQLLDFSIYTKFYSLSDNFYQFTLKTQVPKNSFYLKKLIESLPGVTWFKDMLVPGTGDENLWVYQKEDSMRVIFNYGYNDCPAGCINWNTYEFNVTPDCVVNYTTFRDKYYTEIDEFQESKSGYYLYPNPTSSDLWINSSKEFQFQIFNLIGSLVRNGEINRGMPINVEELPTGNYILKTICTSGTEVFKFQKH